MYVPRQNKYTGCRKIIQCTKEEISNERMTHLRKLTKNVRPFILLFTENKCTEQVCHVHQLNQLNKSSCSMTEKHL